MSKVLCNSSKKELPTDVSPIYYELSEYVSRKYESKSEEYREVIFCIAYAYYSREKQKHISSMLESGGKPSAAVIKNAFMKFQGEENYKEFCEYADNQAKAVSDLAALRAMNGIADVLQQRWENSLEVIIPQVVSSSWIKKTSNFIMQSIIHGIHIIIAAILILLAATILEVVAPPIIDFLYEAGGKYFTKIKNRL